jgi:guanylate kinase
MEQFGSLFILTAASGTGKTTLAKSLVEKVKRLKFSISFTTRKIRPGEENGKDYFFVDQKKFEMMIADGLLLEYATVFDHYYGSSKEWVNEQLRAGNDVILAIDWQGARTIKHHLPQAISIFLLPPSKKELRRRLEERNADHQNIIEKRLLIASEEISHCKDFDYLVINDQLDQALNDLITIIQVQRLKTRAQIMRHQELIKELINNKT